MKSQFSFGLAVRPVHVTKQDIHDGIGRSCTGCAIARALNRTLPEFGFKNCTVELVPYAAWTEARGLEIMDRCGKSIGRIPPAELPEGLIEWAMDFDEWSDFMDNYGGSKMEWKAATGNDYPFCPEPVSFTFNFGKMIDLAKREV